MRERLERWGAGGTALVAAALLTGCAVNPATGKRQLMLVSESQEQRLGDESDPAILEQFGTYDDPELQSYVQELGARMAAQSERTHLNWTFRVVDDPLVNAFALPGGYIYMTRGILAHFNSEAELASVLGHEIGHVTARHSASQLSKAQLTQVGLTAGMIVSDELRPYGDLAQTGFGLLFLKFGRDDERQADDLGLRYMVRTGYDPRPMASVFATLGRVSDSGGGDRPPGWLSTHPDPGNREERTHAAIAEMGRDFSSARVGRDEYLDRIDGIVYGDDPRQGYFKDNLFLHPDMKFRLDFPAGWRTQNTRGSVAGVSSGRDALLRLTLARESTPDAALSKFFEQDGVARTGGWSPDLGGLTAAGAGFLARASSGNVRGRIAFVQLDGRVFQLLGYAAETAWSAQGPAIEAAIASFRRLTDPDALGAQPRRLRIVRPDRTMTAEEFASRFDASVPVETLALLNGMDPGEPFRSGRTYKVIQGGV